MISVIARFILGLGFILVVAIVPMLCDYALLFKPEYMKAMSVEFFFFVLGLVLVTGAVLSFISAGVAYNERSKSCS